MRPATFPGYKSRKTPAKTRKICCNNLKKTFIVTFLACFATFLLAVCLAEMASLQGKNGISVMQTGASCGVKGGGGDTAAIAMHVRSNCDARAQQLQCTYAAIAVG